jgi:hypothetical protein
MVLSEKMKDDRFSRGSSRPCSSWLLFLVLAFPTALVSMWHAASSLTEACDQRTHTALEDFAVRHAPTRHDAVPVDSMEGTAPLHTTSTISSPAASATVRCAPSPYAYVFLMGFCDPDRPTHKPYVAGVSVAAYLLRKYGSRQNMILYVMM